MVQPEPQSHGERKNLDRPGCLWPLPPDKGRASPRWTAPPPRGSADNPAGARSGGRARSWTGRRGSDPCWGVCVTRESMTRGHAACTWHSSREQRYICQVAAARLILQSDEQVFMRHEEAMPRTFNAQACWGELLVPGARWEVLTRPDRWMPSSVASSAWGFRCCIAYRARAVRSSERSGGKHGHSCGLTT